jgi:hypothetical protein
MELHYFYSDSCPHCINFKEKWVDIKKKLYEKKIKYYEYSSDDNVNDNIMDNFNVKYVPSMYVSHNNNNYIIDGIKTNNIDVILGDIEKIKNNIYGGKNEDYYKKKYIQYKYKYIKLKYGI